MGEPSVPFIRFMIAVVVGMASMVLVYSRLRLIEGRFSSRLLVTLSTGFVIGIGLFVVFQARDIGEFKGCSGCGGISPCGFYLGSFNQQAIVGRAIGARLVFDREPAVRVSNRHVVVEFDVPTAFVTQEARRRTLSGPVCAILPGDVVPINDVVRIGVDGEASDAIVVGKVAFKRDVVG